MEMTPVKAIRAFFESDGGRRVTLEEVKALTPEDRAELAPMAAEQLGVTLVEKK